MILKNEKSQLTESAYKDTNLSFSGCDMIATASIALGLSGESYFVTLGSIQTISYSIHMEKVPVRSLGNVNAKDYVYGQRTIAGSLVFAVFNRHILYELFEKIRSKYPNLLNNKNIIMDEIPPFDITISFANEYGIRANMALYGIRIINEGQTMSINDIYTENTYQFVATDIEYLNSDEGKGGLNKGMVTPIGLPETIYPTNVGHREDIDKRYDLKIIKDYDLNKNEIVYKLNVSIKNFDVSLENSLIFRLGNKTSQKRKITKAENNIFMIPKEYEPKTNGKSEVLILEGEEIVHIRLMHLITPIMESDDYTKNNLHRKSYSDIVVMYKSKEKMIIHINKHFEINKIEYLNNINDESKEQDSKKIIEIDMPDTEDAPYEEEKFFQFFIDGRASNRIYINDTLNFKDLGDRIKNNISDQTHLHIVWLDIITGNIPKSEVKQNPFEDSIRIYNDPKQKDSVETLFHIIQSTQKELNKSLIVGETDYIEKLNQREIRVKNNVGKIIIKNLDNKSQGNYVINNENFRSETFESTLNLKNNTKYLIELRDHLDYVIQFAYLFVPSKELMKERAVINYKLKDKISSFRGGGFKFSNIKEGEGEITVYFPEEKPQEDIEFLYIEHKGEIIIEREKSIEVKYLNNSIIQIKRIDKEAYIIKTNTAISPIDIYLNIEEGE